MKKGNIMDITQNKRNVLRKDIANKIRAAIFSGRLAPGDKILETYWAKELGVSQGPVREAIRDLDSIGLVETIPFKGSRVKKMSDKYVVDNYNVRMWLEVKSVKDAIYLLADEDLMTLCKKLDEVLREMCNCAQIGNLSSFSSCDATFHRLVIEATSNEVLLNTWSRCNVRNWFLYAPLKKSQNLIMLYDKHQQLKEALALRNTQAAISIIEDGISSIMLRLYHEYSQDNANKENKSKEENVEK